MKNTILSCIFLAMAVVAYFKGDQIELWALIIIGNIYIAQIN